MPTHAEKYGRAREMLLASAVELFHTEGIRAVSVDAVAARAGISKPMLYRYWTCKDQLVAEALETRHAVMRASLEELLARRTSDSVVDRLLAVFDWTADDLACKDCRGCAFSNAVAELPDRAHPAHAVVRKHKQWLGDRIEQLARDAGLSSVGARQIAARIQMLLEGASVMARVTGEISALREAKAAAASLVEAVRPAKRGR
jgi:AcrR family transcriptional regulator